MVREVSLGFYGPGIEAQSARIDIGKDHLRSACRRTSCGAHERQGRHNHLVARSKIKSHHAQVQRGPAGIHGYALFRSLVFGKGSLEFSSSGSGKKPPSGKAAFVRIRWQASMSSCSKSPPKGRKGTRRISIFTITPSCGAASPCRSEAWKAVSHPAKSLMTSSQPSLAFSVKASTCRYSRETESSSSRNTESCNGAAVLPANLQ